MLIIPLLYRTYDLINHIRIIHVKTGEIMGTLFGLIQISAFSSGGDVRLAGPMM